jgi:hypothetical protein
MIFVPGVVRKTIAEREVIERAKLYTKLVNNAGRISGTVILRNVIPLSAPRLMRGFFYSRIDLLQ